MVVMRVAKKPKKTKKTAATTRRRMNPRLRFGIICGVILIVLGYTLFTLSPLAAGQGGFPGLSALGNWVRQQAINLAVSEDIPPATRQPPPPTTQGSSTLPQITLPKSHHIALAQHDYMS